MMRLARHTYMYTTTHTFIFTHTYIYIYTHKHKDLAKRLLLLSTFLYMINYSEPPWGCWELEGLGWGAGSGRWEQGALEEQQEWEEEEEEEEERLHK